MAGAERPQEALAATHTIICSFITQSEALQSDPLRVRTPQPVVRKLKQSREPQRAKQSSLQPQNGHLKLNSLRLSNL
jgi:hypothetical protein